jgi:prophage regulatory protein
MWETGKDAGRKLNDWQFGCLVEAWCKCFGDLPPDDKGQDPAVDLPAETREPLPSPDTMLRMPDIERLTGLSMSTIKRMVQDGRFPGPLRLGVRAKGWPAADVRAFIELLDEQRKRPRQGGRMLTTPANRERPPAFEFDPKRGRGTKFKYGTGVI